MARFTGDPSLSIEQEFYEPVFVATVTTGAATVSTQLDNKTDKDGLPVMAAGNPTCCPSLMLQCDQDTWITFSSGAGATVVATNAIKILANEKFKVTPKVGRTFVNCLQVTATGTLIISVIR